MNLHRKSAWARPGGEMAHSDRPREAVAHVDATLLGAINYVTGAYAKSVTLATQITRTLMHAQLAALRESLPDNPEAVLSCDVLRVAESEQTLAAAPSLLVLGYGFRFPDYDKTFASFGLVHEMYKTRTPGEVIHTTSALYFDRPPQRIAGKIVGKRFTGRAVLYWTRTRIHAAWITEEGTEGISDAVRPFEFFITKLGAADAAAGTRRMRVVFRYLPGTLNPSDGAAPPNGGQERDSA